MLGNTSQYATIINCPQKVYYYPLLDDHSPNLICRTVIWTPDYLSLSYHNISQLLTLLSSIDPLSTQLKTGPSPKPPDFWLPRRSIRLYPLILSHTSVSLTSRRKMFQILFLQFFNSFYELVLFALFNQNFSPARQRVVFWRDQSITDPSWYRTPSAGNVGKISGKSMVYLVKVHLLFAIVVIDIN